MRVLQDLAKGLSQFVRGVVWLRQHPRFVFMLMVPWLGGILAMIGSVALFVSYQAEIVTSLLFAKPEAGVMLLVYWLCQALLYLGSLVIALLAGVLMVTVIASPIYEFISIAVEREITGRSPPELGWSALVRVVVDEAKKAGLMILVSVVLLLIPGLNVLAILGAAVMMGWSFYDYAPARHGLSFSERVGLLKRDFWRILGFGLWLVIPFIQIVLIPLAIVGGTMLGVEGLKKEQLESR